VKAGYLSEDVVVAAIERSAIKEVFLEMIDKLDKAKAQPHYSSEDRKFYEQLLEKYPSNRRR